MANIKWWRMNTSSVAQSICKQHFVKELLTVNAITTVRYEIMCTLTEETC